MSTLSSDQLKSVISTAGFTGADAAIAYGVAMAESGGRTDAVHINTNGTADTGLFQINDVNAALANGGDLKDAATNARVAYTLFRRDGWHPWTTYNNGAYKKYLGDTMTGPAASTQTAAKQSTAPIVGPVVDAFNAFTSKVSFGANVTGALLVGIVLVVVGLVILLRRPINSLATGKVAAVAKVASAL